MSEAFIGYTNQRHYPLIDFPHRVEMQRDISPEEAPDIYAEFIAWCRGICAADPDGGYDSMIWYVIGPRKCIFRFKDLNLAMACKLRFY
jgi:hypothetical protein